MKMPTLPKQNKQKEADFGIELRRWIESQDSMDICSLEIKHTRGKPYFSFSELKSKQIAYATKIRSKEGVLIRVQGMNGEPDYIYMKQSLALVVIRFPKKFYVIHVHDLVDVMNRSKRKSLTEKEAKEISINL